MILDENAGSWTATEVDGPELSGSTLMESAKPIVVGQPAPEPEPRDDPQRLALGAWFRTMLDPRLLGQIAVVIGSALLVGLLVFVAVRAAVDDDTGANEDRADGDNPLPTVEPGPSDQLGSTDDSSRSVSRRSSAGDDSAAGDSAVLAVTGGGDALDPAGPSAEAPADGEDGRPATSTTEQPTTTTDPTATTEATTTETTNDTTSVSTTSTVASSTTSTTEATTTSTTSGTTTASTTTTTQTTTSTAPPTTPVTTVPTTVETTTTLQLPDQLIASPPAGATKAWDASVRFQANEVPGATKYCWTFEPDQHQVCRSGPTYDLPAESSVVRPGPTQVIAEAKDDSGRRLMEQEIRVDLLASRFLERPAEGDELDPRDRIRLISDDVRTADDYCWDFLAGGVNLERICDDDGRRALSPGQRFLDGVDGEIRIRALAFRGSTVIGRQVVTVTIDGR